MRCRPKVLPDPAGTGLMPESLANAASEQGRSGLSSATMRIWAGSKSIPNLSGSCGECFSTSWPIMSCRALVSSSNASDLRATDRSVCLSVLFTACEPRTHLAVLRGLDPAHACAPLSASSQLLRYTMPGMTTNGAGRRVQGWTSAAVRMGIVGTLVGAAMVAGVAYGPAGRATTPDAESIGPASVQGSVGPWVLTGWRAIPAGNSDQGVATVTLPHGVGRVATRGNADVSDALRARGWWHIGDPDSTRGYLLDAYQGKQGMDAKLFVLTGPDGHRSDFFHRLVPGEMINNSFVAISPSGRWFVSGGWHTVTRLLEFPMPGFNADARPGRDLRLAATVDLSSPIRNVQGCAFASVIQLVCSTSDPRTDLFRVARQLVVVNLKHPLDGRRQIGTPVLLGAMPQVSRCGPAETEGIDIHGDTMLVVAHELGACRGRTDLFRYRHDAQRSAR